MSAGLAMAANVVRLAVRPAPGGFSPFDMNELRRWERGERRVTLCEADTGRFAMLHDVSQVWASWAVIRQGHELLLWDCVSFADVGRFATMADALAAIPEESGMPEFMPAPNVIRFEPFLQRRHEA